MAGPGYRPTMEPVVERARAIADDVFFPAAMATDAADLLPVSHLDLLASEGFYGIAGPTDAGGTDLDPPTTSAVVESLASGCLTTTFVWLQHRNPVRAVAASETPGLRDRWLGAPVSRRASRGHRARRQPPGSTDPARHPNPGGGRAPRRRSAVGQRVGARGRRPGDGADRRRGGLDARGRPGCAHASGRASASRRRERERHRHAPVPRSRRSRPSGSWVRSRMRTCSRAMRRACV